MLANRLLLEAMLAAGSDTPVNEARAALIRSLSTGRVTLPIPNATVVQFLTIDFGGPYLVEYQPERDALIFGATGTLIKVLDGDVADVRAIPNSPLIAVNYTDPNRPSELRRTNDGALIVELSGLINRIHEIPDSPFFEVVYSDSDGSRPHELRQKIDGALVDQDVADVTPIPDSPFFVVEYSDSDTPSELRRTRDGTLAMELSGSI